MFDKYSAEQDLAKCRKELKECKDRLKETNDSYWSLVGKLAKCEKERDEECRAKIQAEYKAECYAMQLAEYTTTDLEREID